MCEDLKNMNRLSNYKNITIGLSLAMFFVVPSRSDGQRERTANIPYDLTIVGFHSFSLSIGRRTIGQIEMLKDELSLNYIDCRAGRPHVSRSNEQDVNTTVKHIIDNKDKTPGTIAFFVDTLTCNHQKLYESLPESNIKLAYVTLESTKAPVEWISVLNNRFDGVVVPDPWLIPILKNSGLEKPVFVLPEICYLHDFLVKPLQKGAHKPFVFGVSALISGNKNYELLIDAFAAEFKNSPDVILKINTQSTWNKNVVLKRIKKHTLKNVDINMAPLSWKDYVEKHMSAIDCYVLISKGEGFSITPRESLALGRPCILANHTAHRTICDSGFVRPVDAPIIVEHDGKNYDGERLGHYFNCTIGDVRAALRDVYQNYESYLLKAACGREWTRQYLAENLKPLYVSLFKPKKILLGKKNEISADYLMTDSQELYAKYKANFPQA